MLIFVMRLFTICNIEDTGLQSDQTLRRRANFRRWTRFWGFFLVLRTLEARKRLLKEFVRLLYILSRMCSAWTKTRISSDHSVASGVEQVWVASARLTTGKLLLVLRESSGELGKTWKQLLRAKTSTELEWLNVCNFIVNSHCTVHKHVVALSQSGALQLLKGFGLSTLQTGANSLNAHVLKVFLFRNELHNSKRVPHRTRQVECSQNWVEFCSKHHVFLQANAL